MCTIWNHFNSFGPPNELTFATNQICLLLVTVIKFRLHFEYFYQAAMLSRSTIFALHVCLVELHLCSVEVQISALISMARIVILHWFSFLHRFSAHMFLPDGASKSIPCDRWMQVKTLAISFICVRWQMGKAISRPINVMLSRKNWIERDTNMRG